MSNMGKILEALYEGNLLAEPIVEKRSEEHQKACNFAFGMLEEFSAKLNENQYYATDRFVRGYCLGALMMMEIFEKRDELILESENPC